MSNLTIETARDMQTEELVSVLEQSFTMEANAIYQACVVIAVLEERGHPFTGRDRLGPVYRFAPEIADGKLSARAAMDLQDNPAAIRAILGYPHAEQDEIAAGKVFKVAVMVDGRVMFQDKKIWNMTVAQMRMAVIEKRTADGQGTLLLTGVVKDEPLRSARKASIEVDSASKDIVVKRAGHVTIDELIPALAALGYQVKPIYGAAGMSPVKVK